MEKRAIKPLFTESSSPSARFIACLILSFLLISVDHQHQHLASLRAMLAVAVYPLQYAASLPVRLVDDLAQTLATRRALQGENEHLRDENTQLQARVLRFAALETENQRLRQLLDSSANRREDVAVAEILTVDSNPAQQQVIINKGSRSHLYVGQPIADAHGLLGQIIQVSPFTATALLVCDERHAVAVEVNRTGLRAVAVGAGESNELMLSFVPTNADIEVGDLITSSGLDNRFPPGYAVGTVTAISAVPGDQFAKISVQPSAQIGHTREVLIVWPERRVDAGASPP